MKPLLCHLLMLPPRWRKNELDVWSIALHNRIITLHQDPQYLYFRSIHPTTTLTTPPTPPSSKPASPPASSFEDDTLALLHHYLNLTPNLTSLYAQWSASDPNFARKAPQFTGIRILRQDAWEALIGFICSSNNNIARIGQMVHKLCVRYGPLLGHLDEEPYHDFPEPKALAQDGVEAELRRLGFGYRAKYIYKTACMVVEKPEGWLDSLRNPEAPVFGGKVEDGGKWAAEGREGYRNAHAELLTLQGVGPKVADCVSLMGLGWGEAVPVDTHVWQIAVKDYKFGKGKHASLTKQTYDAVGNKFRSLWGKDAGWAHSVLFTADLKSFSDRLRVKAEVKAEKEEKVDEVKDEKTGRVKKEVVVKREVATVEEEGDAAEGAAVKEETDAPVVKMEGIVRREQNDDGTQVTKVEVKEEIKQETEDGTIVETETLTRATVKQEQTPIPTTEKASSSTPIKAEHRTQDSPPVKTEQLPTSVKLEKTTRRSIKRERDEDEDTKAEKVEKTASRAKRRRGN
jgi:N-glycosylase/DNA lyase